LTLKEQGRRGLLSEITGGLRNHEINRTRTPDRPDNQCGNLTRNRVVTSMHCAEHHLECYFEH
jgi:tRNA U54 and U55 pseudouridine synthase Pus10